MRTWHYIFYVVALLLVAGCALSVKGPARVDIRIVDPPNYNTPDER